MDVVDAVKAMNMQHKDAVGPAEAYACCAFRVVLARELDIFEKTA